MQRRDWIIVAVVLLALFVFYMTRSSFKKGRLGTNDATHDQLVGTGMYGSWNNVVSEDSAKYLCQNAQGCKAVWYDDQNHVAYLFKYIPSSISNDQQNTSTTMWVKSPPEGYGKYYIIP